MRLQNLDTGPEPFTAVDWLIVGISTTVGAAFILAVAFFVLLMHPARAHDWYPPVCCSGGDCGPLDDKRVKPEGAGGYVVDGKFHVLRADVKDSPDGRFHGCFPAPDRIACFFAPPSGS